MARPLRLQFAGAFYHVLARGNARQDIFLDDQDRRHFLSLLAESGARHGLRVHAYCLMPNHYHLLVETLAPELSLAIKRINGLYGQHFNRRHNRVGHLFQGRFRSLLIGQNSYFLAVHRYVHQNPVRAGLTDRPSDFAWSSCRDYVGLRPPASWLHTGKTLAIFSEDERQGQEAYARFVVAQTEDDPERRSYAQAFLGDRDFVEAMRAKAKTKVLANPEHPAQKLFQDRPEPESVRLALRKHLAGLHRQVSGFRRPERSLELYLLRERCQRPIRELSELFGLSPSGVSRQVSRAKARLLNDRHLRLVLDEIEADLVADARMSNVKT